MALNFGDSFIKQPEEINNTGMQFIQTGATPLRISKTGTAAQPVVIYTVPAGKKVFLSFTILVNGSGTSATHSISISTSGASKKIFYTTVAGTSSQYLNLHMPLVVNSGEEIDYDGTASNHEATIAGWEQ